VRDPSTKPRELDDFPLYAGVLERSTADEEPEAAASLRGFGAVAPLAPRLRAAAADASAVVLIGAVAILAARVWTGRTPGWAGLAWTAGFLLLLSLCATVPALLLFGKTVGMALAQLSTHVAPDGSRVSASAAFRRWVGTLATAATAGVALLWTVRSPDAPTPADRLSGHPLTLE
jgi:hypothetical protein